MAIQIVPLLLHIIVNVFVIAPVLWLSGRALVCGNKAKFADAVLIVVVGTLVGAFVGGLFTGIVAAIVQLVLWLLLVKHFFDCGWLMALAISVVAVVIFILIAIVLGIIGFALIAPIFLMPVAFAPDWIAFGFLQLLLSSPSAWNASSIASTLARGTSTPISAQDTSPPAEVPRVLITCLT